MPNRIQQNPARFIFALYCVIVTYLSLSTGTGSDIGEYDKLAHFVTYAIFTLLASAVARSQKHFVFMCLVIMAYGGILEIGQSFVPGREMSGMDFLANTLGALLGALACYVRVGKATQSATAEVVSSSGQ